MSMMLRFIAIALLLASGGNCMMLRGVKREEEDPNQKIRKLMMSSKSKQVKDDGNIRDDPINTNPPLPTQPAGTNPPASGGTADPDGTCLCATLCWQCNLQGITEGPCKTTCDIAANPTTCVADCTNYMNGGGDDIRDDPGATNPPLNPTDPPGTSPPGYYCSFCEDMCASCSSGASCRTVCEIKDEPTAICDSRCYETLHLGDWGIP